MNNRLIAIACLTFILGCGGKQQAGETTGAAASSAQEQGGGTAENQGEPAAVEKAPPRTEVVEITEKLTEQTLPDNLTLNFDIKDFGKIEAELFVADAPKSSLNIANLAIGGFYKGLTFHRLVPGFVIQGGDPDGTGGGGPGYTVPAEINRKHAKGCLAMARKPDQVNPKKESSGSQFYFCLEALPQLDGEYTVIGQITEGMDVLEKMGAVKTGKKDKPLTPVVMEKVTVTTVKVVEP
jgi:peptidyl-prolyl cis-trans isomerase B (cyclophilin B)